MIHTKTFDKDNQEILGNVKAPNIASRNKTLNQVRAFISNKLDLLTDKERSNIYKIEVYKFDRLVHITYNRESPL